MKVFNDTKNNKKKILFFGRLDCKYSKKLIKKLKFYNFDLTTVYSNKRGEIIPKHILSWTGEYIICFRSLYILPKALLKKTRVASINFHPGPPEYPGSGCFNFALYEEVTKYGVTAHIMNSNIDNGDILEVRRFPVKRISSLDALIKKTHKELFDLCEDFIYSLAEKGETVLLKKKTLSKNEKWRGNARKIKELQSLQTIKPSISKKELERIVKATYTKKYPPKIELHGFKFYLKLDD